MVRAGNPESAGLRRDTPHAPPSASNTPPNQTQITRRGERPDHLAAAAVSIITHPGMNHRERMSLPGHGSACGARAGAVHNDGAGTTTNALTVVIPNHIGSKPPVASS